MSNVSERVTAKRTMSLLASRISVAMATAPNAQTHASYLHMRASQRFTTLGHPYRAKISSIHSERVKNIQEHAEASIIQAS